MIDRLTLEQLRARLEEADLAPNDIGGEFVQALCPACAGWLVATIDRDGQPDITCSNGCRFSRIADEMHNRVNRPPVNGNGATSRAAALLIDLATVPDTPPEYVIEPLAAKGFLTLLPAKRSSYKSFLMMVLAACCHSGGGELAGLRCTGAPALFVDAENGPRLMRRRYSNTGIAVDGLPLADASTLRLPGDVTLLRELVLLTDAELVVLDALRRLTPGLDEDSSRDMAPVMADLANLARETNAAIVLLHHQSSKPGAPPSRGSSSIEDQADVVMRLRRFPGRRLKLFVGEEGKFRIDEEPAPIWLTFGWDGELFTLGETEPSPEDDEDTEQPTAPLREKVGADLLAWVRKQVSQASSGRDPSTPSFSPANEPFPGEGVPGVHPLGGTPVHLSWSIADLARAINRDPKDRTVRNSLEDLEVLQLLQRGEDRRWYPTEALDDGL